MFTIEIRGVWLIKDTAHNGNGLRVVVEMADGSKRLVIDEVADDGPISHYAHARGIPGKPYWTVDGL